MANNKTCNDLCIMSFPLNEFAADVRVYICSNGVCAVRMARKDFSVPPSLIWEKHLKLLQLQHFRVDEQKNVPKETSFQCSKPNEKYEAKRPNQETTTFIF